MTFEEFRATGVTHTDLSLADIPDAEDMKGCAGRVYHGGLYIEADTPTVWTATIGNDSRRGYLEFLENWLYDWAKAEGHFDAHN